MIPARPSPLFSWWFARHAEHRLRRHFSAVHVHQLELLQASLQSAPVLLVANHTSWWDPMWLLVLTRRVLGAEGYALMDARNLEKLPFFSKVGAFGVELDRPEDGARAVRWAARRLVKPNVLLAVFPQGRERPVNARPLGFQAGAAMIARVAREARVIAMGVRYEHRGQERPELWASFQGPIVRTRNIFEARDAQERAVERALDHIEHGLLEGPEASGFTSLHRHRGSRAHATRALAWLTAPRPPA